MIGENMNKFRPFARILGPAAVCVALALAPATEGQGTDGFIADPITSAQFDTIVERLGLSWADRLRAEAAHEEYKVRYLALRQNEIEDLLVMMHKMQSSMDMSMPTRDDIAAILRQREAVVTRIETVDRDLFAAIESIAPPELAPALARQRRQRERDTYDVEGAGGPFNVSQVDLVDILYELRLSDETWDAIEPVVAEYELSSNAARRVLHDKTMDMFVAMFEVMEEMGIDRFQPDFEDPEGMEEFGRAMQEAMERVSKDAQEAAERAQTVDEQSRTLIARVLPPEHAERFEEEYLHRAHPNVYNDWESPERLIRGSLKLEDISADQRSQIEAIESRWQPAYDVLQQKLIALEDEQQEIAASFDMSGESWQQYWEKQQQVQQERSALNQRTREDILKALGEEVAPRVAHLQGPEHLAPTDELAIEAQVAAQVSETIAVVQGDVQFIEGDGTTVRGVDPTLPGAITQTEFRTYLDRMGFSDDQRTLAEDFYSTYRAAYDALSQNDLQQLVVQPQQALWQNNEEGPQDDAIRKLADGRSRGFELIRGLEDQLFLDLEFVLTAEQQPSLPQIRTARERAVYEMGEMTFMGMNRDWVDVGRLVGELGLERDEMRAFHPTLSEYESRVVPIVHALYDNMRAQETAQWRAQREMIRLQQEGGENQMQAWQEYSRIIEPYQTKAAELGRQRAEIEREAKDAFISALPSDKALDFEMRYNRQSYPEVFPDHEDAQPGIMSAFNLRDLTPQQVQEIAIIDDDHRQRYNELCAEMMALSDSASSAMPNFMGGGEVNFEEMIEWQRRQSRMAVLKYQRSEWNATTVRALRAALTEEQAMKVRGLGVDAATEE
jgi:hypothetical protein